MLQIFQVGDTNQVYLVTPLNVVNQNDVRTKFL